MKSVVIITLITSGMVAYGLLYTQRQKLQLQKIRVRDRWQGRN